MIRGLIDFAGPWVTALIAVLMGLAILFVLIRMGGDRSDLNVRGEWKAWLVGGLAVFAILFLISQSISGMKYETCRGSIRQSC